MEHVRSAPFNVMGFNLNSGMGNLLNEQTWVKSAKKLMDPEKAMRQRNLSIMPTSCDESDSRLLQRIDDDKIELLCHDQIKDYVDGTLGRYGQVRSPFTVDYRKDYQAAGKTVLLGIDGEFLELRDCKRINFHLDKTLPKLKVLKRSGFVGTYIRNKEML